jgi:hypothetical protein
VFNNTNIGLVGDATGLRGSSTAGSLYLAFHTADPGESGDQTTSEATYTGYARTAVPRSSSGFTVTGNSVSPTSAISAPACTGGSNTLTHFSLGVASSGTSKILFSGSLSPSISVSSGVTPQLTTSTTIVED